MLAISIVLVVKITNNSGRGHQIAMNGARRRRGRQALVLVYLRRRRRRVGLRDSQKEDDVERQCML